MRTVGMIFVIPNNEFYSTVIMHWDILQTFFAFKRCIFTYCLMSFAALIPILTYVNRFYVILSTYTEDKLTYIEKMQKVFYP